MLSLLQTAIIMTAGTIIFDAVIYGNYFWVLPLVILANLTFLNLGFIVGSLSKSVQAASGLGNLLTMPMMFFSGVFFPLEERLTPVWLHVAEILPLVHPVRLARAVFEWRFTWQALWDLGYIVCLSGALLLWGRHSIRRRLTS